MDPEEDMEIDPAMAAAMGISSFGSKPGAKRKYNSNDGYVDPAISAQTQNTENRSSQAEKVAKAPVDSTTMSERNHGSNPVIPAKNPSEASLEELRNGVRNENGDMVYFKPSFLEDPWKDLKPK